MTSEKWVVGARTCRVGMVRSRPDGLQFLLAAFIENATTCMVESIAREIQDGKEAKVLPPKVEGNRDQSTPSLILSGDKLRRIGRYQGITSRPDYLKPSRRLLSKPPQVDLGDDIVDYKAIDPCTGLEDVDELIRELNT